MRKIQFIVLMITILVLSACQSSKQIKPIKEETIDFDINTAYEMIEKKEKMIIDFSKREKISKEEYNELEMSFKQEFGDRANDILSMFMINNMDTDPESDIDVRQDSLYPTVFHNEVIITDAVIYKSYFENDFFNQTRLSIKQEYVGDDEKLKDWEREYIFTTNENGDWILHGFAGVLNFLGNDFRMNYLEFKLSYT